MKKRKFIFSVFYMFLLTSCSLINHQIDKTKLFIGGNDSCQSVEGIKFSNYLYGNFVKADAIDFDNYDSYQFEIDMKSDRVQSISNIYSDIKFFDVGNCFIKLNPSYKSIDDWFGEGNLVEFWTSCGRYNSDMPFVSSKSYVNQSGHLLAFDNIEKCGDSLTIVSKDYYKETISFLGFKYD